MGLGFIVLNAPYFYKRLVFYFLPQAESQTEIIEAPSQNCLPQNRLQIASLGIDTPVVYVSGTTERVFQEGLKSGVVHLAGTANPGEPGNAYIFGHSSDFIWKEGDYKTVFALLPDMTIGERIYVSNAQGKTFAYEAKKTLVVGPKDLSVIDQHEQKVRMLTLQTSYPLGTALRRFIVQADFVEEVACSVGD